MALHNVQYNGVGKASGLAYKLAGFAGVIDMLALPKNEYPNKYSLTLYRIVTIGSKLEATFSSI